LNRQRKQKNSPVIGAATIFTATSETPSVDTGEEERHQKP
jgi:hypothetical protein